MYQSDPPRPAWETLPTMYDLPSELVGESGLPDEFHLIQPKLLKETCQPANYPQEEVLIATDLNLYYDVRHPLWYKPPDWYLVLGVPCSHQQQDLRLSYVIWQEGIAPFVVIELLSLGTEAEDLGQTLRDVNEPPTKWQVYEQILRVPYYGVYDRYTNHLRIFRLEGSRYQELSLPNQRLWLEEIQLGLGTWQGTYEGVTGLWLRWYDANNHPVPTFAEQAEQERQRAESERQRAETERQRAENERQRAFQMELQLAQEQQRAERLAEYLRSQGIDPNNLP